MRAQEPEGWIYGADGAAGRDPEAFLGHEKQVYAQVMLRIGLILAYIRVLIAHMKISATKMG